MTVSSPAPVEIESPPPVEAEAVTTSAPPPVLMTTRASTSLAALIVATDVRRAVASTVRVSATESTTEYWRC